MNEPLPVDIVVRTFPDLAPTLPAPAQPWPSRALLIDVCTTKPRAGAFSWGGYWLLGPGRERVEGRFYHPGQVAAEEVEAVRQGERRLGLGLLERDQFLEQVLFRSLYKLPLRAALVAWAPEFCISRLAKNVRVICRADGCALYRFTLWTYRDEHGVEQTDFFRPRIDITVAAAGRTLIGFTKRAHPDPQDRIPEGGREPKRGYVYRGRFLSLATAIYDLSGEEVGLGEACRMFDIEPPPPGEPTPATLDARLEALAGLYQAVLAEFAHWPGPPHLAPDRALSPGSLGKSLLRQARLPPPLTRRPPEPRPALGAAMAGFIGPRSEVRLRRLPLAVGYLDAHAMFLAVDVLMRNIELLTHHVTPRHLTTDRELAALHERLTAIGPDELLTWPQLWPGLRGVALVEPAWDVLPSKAAYGPGTEETTTVGPVASAREPIRIPYPDLIVSTLKTGRLPAILEAWEWQPQTPLPGLGRFHLPGREQPVKLTDDDPFLAIAQARQRLAQAPGKSTSVRQRERGLLKVIGVAVGYGAEVEFNLGCTPRGYTVYGPHGPLAVQARPERPGWLCYPPFATFTVAGSRLMVALLERLVHDLGGSIVWIDTDGACIVASEHGALIRCAGGRDRNAAGEACVKALSYLELQQIRRRFQPLADAVGFIPLEPDPTGGPPFRSVFKLEPHNLDPDGRFAPGLECYGVSVKNYLLFRRDPGGNPIAEPRSKFSAHAMGNLVSPIDPETNDPAWIPEAWLWWLAQEEGRKLPEPAWLDFPVMHAMVLAHPDDYQLIRKLNKGKSYDQAIKPFDTLLMPHLDRFLLPDTASMRLVTPWEPDLSRWLQVEFLDAATGSAHRLAIRRNTGSYRDWQKHPDAVFVESMRSYLDKHFTHPEPASLGPDGQPCGRQTRGLLTPIPIRVERQVLAGKDTHRLRERRAGWRQHQEARATFHPPDHLRERILPILAHIPEQRLRAYGLEPRTLRKVRTRAGRSITAQLARRMEQAAIAFAREQLRASGQPVPANPHAACAAYLEQRDKARTCRWPGCETALAGRQRRWCARHAGRSGKDRAR